MNLARLALTVSIAVVLLSVFATSSAAGPDQPDISSLVDSVELERVRSHIEALEGPRNSFSQPDETRAAAGYVQSELESYGYPVQLFPVAFKRATFPNVVGVREGTMCPERVFVIGAHYDSVPNTPGADDNASGIAGMLEVARALHETPLPATVWFVGFALEENGLVGSFNMSRDAESAGTEIVGMVSLEMLGYTTDEANFIIVLGNTASIRLTDAFRRAGDAYVPELTVPIVNLPGNGEEQPDSRRSDHAPFWDAGYQAVMVTDTANFRNPNYHEPSDTLDTLDLTFATNVTKEVLATTVDYLTYDGDDDGAPDVCSGPLIATPTNTPDTPPSATPAESLDQPRTMTPPPVGQLPDAGGGVGDGSSSPVLWLVAGGLLVVLGAGSLRLLKQRL